MHERVRFARVLVGWTRDMIVLACLSLCASGYRRHASPTSTSQYLHPTTQVFEETGIRTQFVTMAAITEFHSAGGPARTKTSDLYCVCVLRLDEAHGGEQQAIHSCEREVRQGLILRMD